MPVPTPISDSSTQSTSNSMPTMESEPKITLYNGRKASLALDIVVVGCGLGGLSAAYCLAQAGHKVTILESASQIGEVGAGIQMGPNLTRLLTRWGLAHHLEELCVEPTALTLRRWNTGETVAWTWWGNMKDKYGSPYYHIHRADLHNLLLNLALPHIRLRLNSRVVAVDPVAPSLTLTSGEVVHCDLVIGADGVKSLVREVVVGGPDRPVPTGDAAYRAIVPTSEMIKDPDLKPLVDAHEMCGWMGPGRHIMGYNIRGGKEYNLVLAHPDHGSVESWTAEGSAEKMKADFVGWSPVIQKMINLVPSTLVWTLMDRAPLGTWVHKNGRIALLGDACHPMLPYRAQGSAMAVEDSAVLGNLFSRLSHRSQIEPLLHAYQELRYERATETQADSRGNQHIFHLPDGPEQQARDDSMRAAMKESLQEAQGQHTDQSSVGNANVWADREKSMRQFGYDADTAAEQWWVETGEKTIGVLALSARM